MPAAARGGFGGGSRCALRSDWGSVPHRGVSVLGRAVRWAGDVLLVGRPTLRADTPRYVPFSPLRKRGPVPPGDSAAVGCVPAWGGAVVRARPAWGRCAGAGPSRMGTVRRCGCVPHGDGAAVRVRPAWGRCGGAGASRMGTVRRCAAAGASRLRTVRWHGWVPARAGALVRVRFAWGPRLRFYGGQLSLLLGRTVGRGVVGRRPRPRPGGRRGRVVRARWRFPGCGRPVLSVLLVRRVSALR
ncbi:hypothetical protein QF037_005821 [Streptomyces canus]|nr:hypothetical protein [Streptomyces canus]